MTTFTIGPATQTVRKFVGMTTQSHRDNAKFSIRFADGIRGSLASWDSVLGERWDLIPDYRDEDQLDTVIKTLKMSEHREFGLFTIRCQITTETGRYRLDNSYRTVIRENLLENSKVDSYLAE